MHVQTENKVSCLYIYVCWKQVDEGFSFWKNNNWHCLCLSPSLLLKKKLKGADQSCPCGRFWQLHLCGWKLSRTRKRHKYNQRADLWEQLISICPSVYVLMFVLIYRSNTSDFFDAGVWSYKHKPCLRSLSSCVLFTWLAGDNADK